MRAAGIGMVACVKEFFSNLEEQLSDIWRGMDNSRRWLVLGLTAGVLFFLIFGIIHLTRADYVPVFTKMQAEDAAEVVSFLKDQSIPYQIGQQGTAVLVPQGKVSNSTSCRLYPGVLTLAKLSALTLNLRLSASKDLCNKLPVLPKRSSLTTTIPPLTHTNPNT